MSNKFSLPINLNKWIEEHKDQLTPPVCNKLVFEEKDFIIMVVGGPNARKDYHCSDSAEIFYQLKGDMILNIMDGDQLTPITIKEGEMFLLPPNISHAPKRFADTIGLVIERVRTKDELDSFQWFCENCNHLLYECQVNLKSIEHDLPEIFEHFYQSAELRSCDKCGTVM